MLVKIISEDYIPDPVLDMGLGYSPKTNTYRGITELLDPIDVWQLHRDIEAVPGVLIDYCVISKELMTFFIYMEWQG